MSDMILFKDGMRIGKTELDWLQDLGQANTGRLAAALAQQVPAVLPNAAGALGTELQVTAGASDVTVAIGSAVLADGTYLSLSTATTLSVSTNVTNLPVVLRADATPFGLGTMALAADRVTLTYTPASGSTLNAAYYYGPNDAVRLVDGATNKGTFRVLSVSTNTVVLADSVPGTGTITGLKHAPAGKFFPGFPTGDTTDMISYDVAGLRLATAGYTAASNEIILATVTRGASGAPVVTDARTLFRARGTNNIDNSMVSATAGIAESKIDLSPELLKAKQLAPFFDVTADSRISTKAPDLYVTRNGELRRVLVESDIVIPAFTDLSVSPSASSITSGQTVALTAATTVQSGATVTYTFTSSNTAVATVTSTGASATVTAVSEGVVYVTVRATAPAVGSFVAATDTVVVPITVTGVATSSILQTLSLSPASLSLTLASTATAVTATTTSPVGATPTITWSWQLEAGSENLVTLSATNTASITVTPRATGIARVRLTASAPASGGFVASTLNTTLVINVAAGLTLTLEPGDNPIRVSFARTDAGSNIQAYIRWGIGGTFTYSNPTATLTITDTDASGITYNASSLVGQAFYDNVNTKYLITANTASSANPKTVTLTKIVATDPNPVPGNFVIRSHATDYTATILSADGTQVYGSPANFTLTNRVWVVFPSGVSQGTTYKFRLTGRNPNLSPSTINNDRPVAWGSGSGGAVLIPSPWISSTSTAGSATFTWSLLTGAGYYIDRMDYQIQTKVGDNAWGPWTRVSDDAVGATSLSYTVVAPASTLVQARVRIVGLDGSTLINSPVSGYDGEAQQTTLASASQGTPIQLHYPVTITSGSTWTQLPGTSRYILSLSQIAAGTTPIPTSFTTAVVVERIDLAFSGTALTQPAGTASVKAIVYPASNTNFQVAGTPVVQGQSQFQYALNLNTSLPVNANGEVKVALEYIPSGNPNDLEPTGVGYVTVHYRTAT